MPELITGISEDGSYQHQREVIPGTKRIAGPGCNVTATTLALQPGIAQGLVEPADIVADLVVGYSGAGKNLKRVNLLAAEAFGSALPYSVGGTHRHIPEILQNFAHAAGKNASAANEFTLGFTPILVPMARGILASVSAKLTDTALNMSDAEIRQVWTDAYADQDFMIVYRKASCRPPPISSDRTRPIFRWPSTVRRGVCWPSRQLTISTAARPDRRCSR